MEELPAHTNRLFGEKSPYLLQHAHNPVDWYLWGKEAFDLAKETNKPIFLSIGYSTCHWCHVMEKESFEDRVIAERMNEVFINIKVDREELPEVDDLYMEFAQTFLDSPAGWPLNIVMTPDRIPFFAATYLPPHPKRGLIGFYDLIERVEEIWHSGERELLLEKSHELLEIFKQNQTVSGVDLPHLEAAENAGNLLLKLFDPAYGGLRGAPKFPIGYQSVFFLHYYLLKNDRRAAFLAERTLEMMHRGGIYDHLGGGFSRYSVDAAWQIPHFEKMLYDNAILSEAYLSVWQLTNKPLYRSVAQDILDYILRDMTHPEGGFYSAEDADSEGKEGLFYTWTIQEVYKLLGEEKAPLFCEFYNITLEGNFSGRNVLSMQKGVTQFAEEKGVEPASFETDLNEQRAILWRARSNRQHPFKDDKILAAWNGLMIRPLALAAQVFDSKRYLEAALKAANFIDKKMFVDGRLFRRWRDGESRFNAGLSEYACMIRAYLTLFEIGEGSVWLEKAILLSQILEKEFKAPGGAFYQTDEKNPDPLIRKCEFRDGVEPSGNAVHTENLLKLWQITFNSTYLEQAQDVLKSTKTFIDNHPTGCIYQIMNLFRYYDQDVPTVVVAIDEKQTYKKELQQLLFSSFQPNRVVIWKTDKEDLVPDWKKYLTVGGATTLYVCHQGRCKKPINSFSEMHNLLLHKQWY